MAVNIPLRADTENIVNGILVDYDTSEVVDNKISQASLGGGGETIPQMVSESLNTQGTDDVVMRISFSGDTTTTISATSNQGVTFTPTYSEASNMTIYVAEFNKSLLDNGVRIIATFMMGDVVIWNKNYCGTDFGLPSLSSDVDSEPTENSSKLITSGGVYEAINSASQYTESEIQDVITHLINSDADNVGIDLNTTYGAITEIALTSDEVENGTYKVGQMVWDNVGTGGLIQGIDATGLMTVKTTVTNPDENVKCTSNLNAEIGGITSLASTDFTPSTTILRTGMLVWDINGTIGYISNIGTTVDVTTVSVSGDKSSIIEIENRLDTIEEKLDAIETGGDAINLDNYYTKPEIDSEINSFLQKESRPKTLLDLQVGDNIGAGVVLNLDKTKELSSDETDMIYILYQFNNSLSIAIRVQDGDNSIAISDVQVYGPGTGSWTNNDFIFYADSTITSIDVYRLTPDLIRTDITLQEANDLFTGWKLTDGVFNINISTYTFGFGGSGMRPDFGYRSDTELDLIGREDRPTYNGEDVALLKDVQASNISSGYVYKTINLTDVKIGDDLSGATINFNPNNLPIFLNPNAGLSGFQWVIWTPVGGININVAWNANSIQDGNLNYIYNVSTGDLTVPNWIADTYTFPSEGAIVTELRDLQGNRQNWDDVIVGIDPSGWSPTQATVNVRVNALTIGDSNLAVNILGTEFLYNGKNVAVEHEIGDTIYQTGVDIPFVYDLSGNKQELIDKNELQAHADHDAQMFDNLTAQIVAGQFTQQQIEDIANAALQAAEGDLVTETELSSAVQTINNSISTEGMVRLGADNVLLTNLNTEIANRVAGDAQTLLSAKNYVDSAIVGLPREGWNRVYNNTDTTAMAIGQVITFSPIPGDASDIIIMANLTNSSQSGSSFVYMVGGVWFQPDSVATVYNSFKIITADGTSPNISTQVTGWFRDYGTIELKDLTANSYITNIFYRRNDKSIMIDGDSDAVNVAIQDAVNNAIISEAEGWVQLWSGNEPNRVTLSFNGDGATRTWNEFDEFLFVGTETTYNSGSNSTLLTKNEIVDGAKVSIFITNNQSVGTDGSYNCTQLQVIYPNQFNIFWNTPNTPVCAIYGRKYGVNVTINSETGLGSAELNDATQNAITVSKNYIDSTLTSYATTDYVNSLVQKTSDEALQGLQQQKEYSWVEVPNGVISTVQGGIEPSNISTSGLQEPAVGTIIYDEAGYVAEIVSVDAANNTFSSRNIILPSNPMTPVKTNTILPALGVMVDLQPVNFEGNLSYTDLPIGSLVYDSNGSIGTVITSNSGRIQVETISTISDYITENEFLTQAIIPFTNHRETDIARWSNAYKTERRTMEQNIYAMGGKIDTTQTHNITIPTYNVTDDNGGIIDITTTNHNGQFVTVNINGVLAYTTDGIIDDVPLEKSFQVNNGDVFEVIIPDSSFVSLASITPAVIDPNNPITVLRDTMSQNIFNLQQQILNINAARANKHIGTVVVDIQTTTENGGYTVPANDGLGGQIAYEGIDFLLGSSGWVDVNGNRVYDYGGLLGLKIGTSKEVRDVMDGDLIETGGLNSITYTAYVEGQA